MAGLGGYTPKVETVEYPGGAFTVRGLSLTMLVSLLGDHKTVMTRLFDKFLSEAEVSAAARLLTDGDSDVDETMEVILEAVELAPALVAATIAQASGEPDKTAEAADLPMVVQIDALRKIANLTLEAEGGLEKLSETAASLMSALTSAAPATASP